VRFDADGIAEQISDEEQACRSSGTNATALKIGVTEWGSDFADVHARVQENGLRFLSQSHQIRSTRGSLKVLLFLAP